MRKERCLSCTIRDCNGLKYSPYNASWVCPYLNNKLIADTKTTITNPAAIYGTKSKDGTERE